MTTKNKTHNKNSSDGTDVVLTGRGVQFAVDTSNVPPVAATNNNPNNDNNNDNNKNNNNKYRAQALRGNLTREQKDRDPLFYYEVVSVLGVGSMGSVAKVKKRAQVIGGSARRELQTHFQRERRMKTCFELPLVGGFLAYCLKGLLNQDPTIVTTSSNERTTNNNSSNRSIGSTTNSSLLQPAAHGVVEDYNDPAYRDNDDDDDDDDGLTNNSSNNSSNRYELICAMKSIHLNRVTDPDFVQELKNEVSILKKLDHPHIVKAIETFEHRNQIFIVMELCSGGDLYSRDPYTEAEAARIVASITSAIAYMHSKNICHRDLKYENILFVNSLPRAEIKLIDFGLSRKFGGDEELTEGVGTIYTMAPEVLKGSYTKQADLWSVGVIAFMLLSSQMPFYGRKRRHIVEQIMHGRYEFKGRRWKRISAQAKEFVQDLLCVDPEERAAAEEALSASWLNRRFTATVRNPYQEELASANQSILAYSKYSKIKQIALLICAHKATTTEIGILRKVFQKYDTEKNGQLSYDEFKAALRDAGYSEKEYRTIFDAVDLDGTGKIRYTEFLAATIEAQGAISEERLAEAFDRMDADDSGYISKENLRSLLGEEFPQSKIDAIIDEADLTRDGKISYSEFLALWEVQNEGNRLISIEEVRQLGASHSGRSTDSEESSLDEATPEALAARANFIEHKQSSERKVIEAVKEVAKKVGTWAHDGHESKDKTKQVLFSDGVKAISNGATYPTADALQQQDQQQQERQVGGTGLPPLPIKHVASV